MGQSTEVQLEPFSTEWRGALTQIGGIRRAVQRSDDWLPSSRYAGSQKRYGRGLIRATRQAHRVAQGPDLDVPVWPFAVRVKQQYERRWRTRGIATLIGEQTIILPGFDEPITGYDADYWLESPIDREAHLKTAQELIRTAGELTVEASGDEHQPFTAFALMAMTTSGYAQSHQPWGFTRTMRRVGEPTRPQMPEGVTDTYGILMDGALAQVYVHTGFACTPPGVQEA